MILQTLLTTTTSLVTQSLSPGERLEIGLKLRDAFACFSMIEFGVRDGGEGEGVEDNTDIEEAKNMALRGIHALEAAQALDSKGKHSLARIKKRLNDNAS